MLHKEPSEGKLGDLYLKLLAPEESLYATYATGGSADSAGQLVLVLHSIGSDALAFASDDG